jgi:NADH-quinone oxidoreductase subunit M
MMILLSVLIPMALSLAAYIAARRSSYLAGYISAAALMPLLLISAYSVFTGSGVCRGLLPRV